MKDIYADFFIQYCRFISKDLISTFDTRLGRNTKVISVFFRVFFVISKKDTNKSSKEKAIVILKKLIDSYLSDGDVNIYSSMYHSLECSNKDFTQPLHLLKPLGTSLNDFAEAVKDFNKIFENQLFKQGMIEFNNALAHLFAGFSTSSTNLDLNIKKASTHLYRGALDYYKTIIKKKESFTHEQKEELIKIRTLEIASIGLKISNSDKDDILVHYRDFARKLYKINNS